MLPAFETTLSLLRKRNIERENSENFYQDRLILHRHFEYFGPNLTFKGSKLMNQKAIVEELRDYLAATWKRPGLVLESGTGSTKNIYHIYDPVLIIHQRLSPKQDRGHYRTGICVHFINEKVNGTKLRNRTFSGLVSWCFQKLVWFWSSLDCSRFASTGTIGNFHLGNHVNHRNIHSLT